MEEEVEAPPTPLHNGGGVLARSDKRICASGQMKHRALRRENKGSRKWDGRAREGERGELECGAAAGVVKGRDGAARVPG